MRNKASKSHTGVKFSESHKKAISEGQRGCIRQKQRVSIVQLDLYGKLIKIWDSLTTVKQELNIKVNLNRKTSGGISMAKV